MIKFPSFSPQSAIFLTRVSQYKMPDDKDLLTLYLSRHEYFVSEEWILKCLTANKKIHGRMPPPDVSKCEVVVSEDFSLLIMQAFTEALRLTRYMTPEEEAQLAPLDGVAYQFHCAHYAAETYSPKEGIPLMCINLGEKLEALIKARSEDRKRIEMECIDLAKEIIKESKKAETRGKGSVL